MRSSALFLLALSPFAVLSRMTNDATCGGSKGYTCLDSAWGDCCSQYGWCGSTSDYCGDGCNPGFGLCDAARPSSSTKISSRASTFSTKTSTRVSTSSTKISTRSSTSSTSQPSSAQPVSTNARCGSSFGGKTCLGSKWGDCCSQYSYCGSTSDYCDANTCQKGYGKCNTVSASSSSSRSSTRSSSSLTQSSSTRSSSSSTRVSSTSSSISSSASSSRSTSSSATGTASSSFSTHVSSSISSTASSSPSASPSPAASCYTGTFADACSTTQTDKYKDGYLIKCGQRPRASTRTVRLTTPGLSYADDCATTCTLTSGCIAVIYSPGSGSEYNCDLLSEVSRNFVAGSGATFLQDAAALAACPSRSSSSSLSLATSFSVSSSASSSSANPSITSSTATSSTPSSSPVACYTGTFANACPAANKQYKNGYRIECGLSPKASDSTLLYRLTAAEQSYTDFCITTCTLTPSCVAAFYAPNAGGIYNCDLYSRVGRLVQGITGGATYLQDAAGAACGSVASSSSSSTRAVSTSSASSVSSSSSVLSSSSSSASATSSSASPSATPNAACSTPSNCMSSFGTFITNTCPAINNACASGYQAKCNSQPGQGSTSGSKYGSVTSTECLRLCTADSTCAGVTYDTDETLPVCTFFTTIRSVISTPNNMVTTYLKLCASGSTSSSSSSSVSSSISATSSSASASPTSVSSSASSSASSSVSSSASATSSSASPTSVSSSASSSVASSTSAISSSASPSATPAGSHCTPANNCATANTPVTRSCPTSNVCGSQFQNKCSLVPSGDSAAKSLIVGATADSCLSTCGGDATCAGFQYSTGTVNRCVLYSSIVSLVAVESSNYNTYLKLCV